MPYVDQGAQEAIHAGIIPTNAGELNFAITKLIIQYVKQRGLRYQQINDVVGALEGAKLEFVNRVVNPYELQKRIDVDMKFDGDPYKELMCQLQEGRGY